MLVGFLVLGHISTGKRANGTSTSIYEDCGGQTSRNFGGWNVTSVTYEAGGKLTTAEARIISRLGSKVIHDLAYTFPTNPAAPTRNSFFLLVADRRAFVFDAKVSFRGSLGATAHVKFLKNVGQMITCRAGGNAVFCAISLVRESFGEQFKQLGFPGSQARVRHDRWRTKGLHQHARNRWSSARRPRTSEMA